MSSDLSWEAHVNTICARVAPRLYYLKQLKRTGLPAADSLYYYLTVIRPVLEYGCALWHHGLTVAQSQKLESLQKRALRIISQIVCDMPYESACAFAGVQPLSARRYELGRRFFRSITQSDSCLDDLLPQRRDSEILSRLRRHSVYPIPLTKTNKYRDLLFTMPWLNISNRINKILHCILMTVMIVGGEVGYLRTLDYLLLYIFVLCSFNCIFRIDCPLHCIVSF